VYAIIEDSGQQFKVSEGDVVNVDLRELDEGATTIDFSRVLLVADGEKVKIGTPVVEGAKVVGTIEKALFAGEKVRIFKYKRRKGYRLSKGHRQKYTQVRITKIVA
jgi:large subunit ribosomal protein L21